MSKLPVISARECVKALESIGFRIRHQQPHIIMQKDDPYTVISVPNHKELKRGTLRKIIRDTGLTVAEFVDLL